MQEQLPKKLYKTGEHGEGRHVLVVYSDTAPSNILPYKDLISSSWKLHYFCIELDDSERTISEKLENTFNYYHYATTLVLDFPAFLYYLKNIERLSLGCTNLNKIIVYNPLGMPMTLRERVMGYFLSKSYTNLLGRTVVLPEQLTKQFQRIIGKIGMLHADGITVIGMSDPASAFRIAAHSKNSTYKLCSSYQDAAACVIEEFD
jgi:hypothetical protein